MVNLFLLHAMAAPSDPLSFKLQKHHSSNPNPNSNNSPWGTWEELLLGRAVLKHGADNWALVSTELQSRARASFSFTPEACRAGYQAIKLRFGADEGRDGSAAHWYEELRRLRVAHLKRELQQCDNSIGSLENKIKRLQSEDSARAKSSIPHTRAKESTDTPEPTLKFSGDESARAKIRLPETGRESKEAREPRLQVVGHESNAHGSEKPYNDMGKALDDDATKPKDSFALDRLSSHGPAERELATQGRARSYTSRTDDLVSAGVETPLPALIHPSGKAAPAPSANGGEELQASALQRNGGNHDGGQLTSQINVSLNLGDTHTHTLHGDVSAKQGVSPSLKSVNIEDCKNSARAKAKAKASVCVVDGGEKSEESESLCSPRVKSSPTGKRWRSPGFGKDARVPDHVDDKRMVRKSVGGEKNFVDALSSLPVESADSTEGKGGQALAGKTSSLEPMTLKVKKEMSACMEEDAILPKLGAEVEHSRRLSTGPLNAEARNHSPSSTENSLHHEVWGESVEADDREMMKRANKRRRLLGRDRKRKATASFNTADLEEDDRGGVAEPSKQVEFTVKTESMTTSQEASESMHSPLGKENYSEAWHQAERLSGDSMFEKSEMGSYVDGNEDISPMSRRNRREPKVSGKLIPLLESLRTVCAHRCAHFFRHNQEPEENRMYYRMVRMPIDLGTIRAKLEEGQYSGSMHFFRDLLLMVTNASVFYPRDSSEAAAASGLRECIMKEMGHVFETEVLVKQEGPSFRKRDVRQLAGANQGRRKGGGLKLYSAAVEKPSRDPTVVKQQPLRDLAATVKQSDVSTSVESRRPSHQALASRFDEKARSSGDFRKVEGGKRSFDIQTSHEGSRLLVPGPSMKAHAAKEPGSLKLGSSSLEKPNEVVKEPGSDKSSINTVSKEAKLKHKLPERGIEKKGEFSKAGSISKASAPSKLPEGGIEKKGEFSKVGSTSKASAPSKGIESSGRKPKAVLVPDGAQEPVKRGVGRPPKHSQLQKARELEMATNASRKRVKR